MLEKLFKLKENNTSVRTELVAGLTIFGGVLLGQWTKPVARARQPLASL